MIQLLRKRNFALLWFGGLISMIGNWVLLAALPFHVYDITGSALATSGVMMAYVAPGVIFGSVAGVFVDRWNRQRVMINTALLQSAVLFGLLFVQNPGDVWLIYLVVFLEATLAHFFSPAESALLPKLVGKEQLAAANGMNGMNDNLARLVGPALGGALLGLVGFSSVILVDAISYLLAAALILLIRVTDGAEKPAATAQGGGVTAVWREWLAGLRLVINNKILAAIFLVIGVALFGDAIISAVLVVFVQDTMGLSAVEFGWMMTARGIGGLLGGILIGQVAARVSPGRLVVAGITGTAVLILAMLAYPQLVFVLPALVVMGITAILWIVTIQTLLQQHTEDAYMGRVFGAFGTTTTLLMFVGSGLAGLLTDQLGDMVLMTAAGGITLMAALVALLRLVPALQGAVDATPTQVQAPAEGSAG